MRPVIVLGVMLFTLLGCNLTLDGSDSITITPETPPSETASWQVVAPGIEHRDMDLQLDGGESVRAIVVRLDPAWVTFRVHYSRDASYSISGWREQLPGAAIIVNGGFFDTDDYAIGMLVSDGQVYGQSYSGFGGMFQVDTAGLARVRSLGTEPYQGEALSQAVQAFPMLIEASGVRAPQDVGFDDGSRRTLIAQDSAGRIIVAVIPYQFVTLNDLQTWLLTSDLDVQIALGLDGGRSTGMVISTPGYSAVYPSLDKVPDVIAVYTR